jgi:hypothetical protein
MPLAFLAPNWCDLSWSEWVTFDAAAYDFQQLPAAPGMYRVMALNSGAMAYIGQTGRPLRERLGALRVNTMKSQMPWNDPHTAAPALWSYRDACNEQFACSAAPITLSVADRCGLECYLLWRYRLEQGRSTLCNFGRLHQDYRKSRNRSTGDRGGRISTDNSDRSAQSLPALTGDTDYHALTWMGLAWTAARELASVRFAALPRDPGVYRLIDGITGELLYIGESRDVAGRLQVHTTGKWDGRNVLYAFVTLPTTITKAQRLEIESDLIGAYFELCRAHPVFQFQRLCIG